MTRWIVLVLIVVLLAGCHGVVRKDFDTQGNTGNLKIGDPALAAMVRIVSSDSQYVDGHLNVRILLRNRTHLRRAFEYKVVFSDDKGFPLDEPWGWRPLNLEPRGDGVIEVKSFSPDAATFQLRLQRASMEDLG